MNKLIPDGLGELSLKGRWHVDVKGEAMDEGFEICVIREDNEHGHKSYGWFSQNKLLISHNDGPCCDPLIPLVWNKMLKLAQEVADELNAAEKP